MRIYITVGVLPAADTAALEAFCALAQKPLTLGPVGPDGRRWLTVQGDIDDHKLHQIAALVDFG